MNEQQAVQILEQALNVASLKGSFGLSDSANILQALSVLKNAAAKNAASAAAKGQANPGPAQTQQR
jgi:hypothetical protein